MKKRFLIIFLQIFLLISILGCASAPTIRFSVLEPGEVNMKNYRNIAVTTTAPYRGWVHPTGYLNFRGLDRSKYGSYYFNVMPFMETVPLQENVAHYANNLLVEALRNTNYFHSIITGYEADSLRRRGTGIAHDYYEGPTVDAFINSEITDMYSDEWIEAEPIYRTRTYKDKDGKSRSERYIYDYDYSLHQMIRVSVTYTVVDAKTYHTLTTKTVSDRYSRTLSLTKNSRYSYSFYPCYQYLLKNLNTQVLKTLAPHKVTKTERLKPNKPKLEQYNDAWDLVENNNLEFARSRFEEAWKNFKHVPSGYNAGVLYFSFGKYDEAIAILNEVYQTAGDVDSAGKSAEISRLRAQEERAKSQF